MKQETAGFEKLDEIVQLSILYDFYGELLTEHKKRIFEDYVLNDLSLSEIAEEQKISRQGVHDAVKRCSQELKNYESKLFLVHKFDRIQEKLNRIKEISSSIRMNGDLSEIDALELLADDILKEL